MNCNNPTFNVGDVLSRQKLFGLIKHMGVVVAPNTVLQNTPEKGEHLVTVNEFCSGQPVEVKASGANPQIVGARCQKILADPKRYDAATRNCEHTVYEVIFGIAKSPQFIIGLVIVCFLAIVAWVVLRRP